MKNDFPTAGRAQLKNFTRVGRQRQGDAVREYYSLRAILGRHPRIVRLALVIIVAIALLPLIDYVWSYAVYS